LERVTWSEFKKLRAEEKFLLSGHSFVVFGGCLLAFGNLIRLLKGGELPVKPILDSYEKQNNDSLYKTKKSYFDS
jgi:hypothetical protein